MSHNVKVVTRKASDNRIVNISRPVSLWAAQRMVESDNSFFATHGRDRYSEVSR